jgi:hypothetical protein
MSQASEKVNEIYPRITDTIFAVIMGLSFREYYQILVPPVFSQKLAILVFAYLVVVVSRVLYHKSISHKPYRNSKRFFADLWILYMYFVLAFSPGVNGSSPNILLLLVAQVGVFVGYAVWSGLQKREYPETTTNKLIITLICLGLVIIITGLFLMTLSFGDEVILGGSIHDWVFLCSEYSVMALFWGLKQWPLKGNLSGNG